MRFGPGRWTVAGLLILAETLCVASLYAGARLLQAGAGQGGPPFGLATLWLTVVLLCLCWALAGDRLAGPMIETPVLLWHMALILIAVLAFAGGLLAENAAERAGAVAFSHPGARWTTSVELLLAGNILLFVPWLALLRVLANAAGLGRLYLHLNWLFVSAWASTSRAGRARPVALSGPEGERARRRAMAVMFVFAILLALFVAYVRDRIEHG